ncbi:MULTISPECIES: DUF6153 family protein [Catenuloplanes]|uniref:Uncharacterized protein n=1 Tax=Catenuloplanes niger TaxID=587534 RepID=A0AAE3ZPF1_9ACTN|nr:DUF6153 family protein [Catenuloplanes niger]MDR7322652.1 hypothetical protein [Catenuloplanes niger]
MAGDQVTAGGRWARWLLLACTIIGLAAMHTLGHSGPEADGHGHAGHHPPEIAVGADMPAGVAADGGCAGCGQVSGPEAPERGGMSVWSVCVAVLTGLTAAIVMLALLVRWRAPTGGPPRARAGPPLVHGPPPRRTGLTLAAISVLRI